MFRLERRQKKKGVNGVKGREEGEESHQVPASSLGPSSGKPGCVNRDQMGPLPVQLSQSAANMNFNVHSANSMQAAAFQSQFQLPTNNFQSSNMLGQPDSLFAVDEHENELLFSQHHVGGTGLINLQSGVINENTTDHFRGPGLS